jgi:hypothetical protein
MASLVLLLASGRAFAGSPGSALDTVQVSVDVVRSCRVLAAASTATVDCGARLGSADLEGARRQPAPRVIKDSPDRSTSTADATVTIVF